MHFGQTVAVWRPAGRQIVILKIIVFIIPSYYPSPPLSFHPATLDAIHLPDFVELSRRRRQTNTLKFSCFDRRVASKPASVTRACFSRVGTGLSRSQFAKLLKEALRSHRKRRTKYAALTVSRSERRKTRKKPSCISWPQETILKTLNKRRNNKKQLIINIMSNFSQAISYLLERYMA